jgi:hypothetical protein
VEDPCYLTLVQVQSVNQYEWLDMMLLKTDLPNCIWPISST